MISERDLMPSVSVLEAFWTCFEVELSIYAISVENAIYPCYYIAMKIEIKDLLGK